MNLNYIVHFEQVRHFLACSSEKHGNAQWKVWKKKSALKFPANYSMYSLYA